MTFTGEVGKLVKGDSDTVEVTITKVVQKEMPKWSEYGRDIAFWLPTVRAMAFPLGRRVVLKLSLLGK